MYITLFHPFFNNNNNKNNNNNCGHWRFCVICPDTASLDLVTLYLGGWLSEQPG